MPHPISNRCGIYLLCFFFYSLQGLIRNGKCNHSHIHRRHITLIKADHNISLFIHIESSLIRNSLKIPFENFTSTAKWYKVILIKKKK